MTKSGEESTVKRMAGRWIALAGMAVAGLAHARARPSKPIKRADVARKSGATAD
jgi:hypothetical protein